MGQRWTTPVYSPFRPLNSPMEMLEATVERREPILWNGGSVSTLVVVYRADSGMSLTSEPRGKLWVRSDGTVLRQEVTMLNSHLQFTRLGARASRRLSSEIETYGSGEIPADVNKQLMRIVQE
jgi:hypothetical protein